MAFRVVFIENEVGVRMKLDNLVLETYEGEVWIPISDISTVVLDNLKITLTTRLLSMLATNNVILIVCNEKHLPIGLYCSYDNHSRVFKHIGYQINTSKEKYNEIWKNIVIRKILNQADVIEKLGKNNEISRDIRKMASEIKDGDITNNELC